MKTKKITSVLIALMLGVASSFASGNTNYDFTATFSNNSGSYNNNNYTLNGVATVDNTTFITTISSLYENGVVVTPFSPTGRIASPGTGYGYNNFVQIGSPDFAFTVSYYSYLYPDVNTGGKVATASFQSFSGTTINMADGSGTGYGRTTVSISSGAPEIDGSLAPKVGFLLGCLFLMFGCKKQKAEPMLTA